MTREGLEQQLARAQEAALALRKELDDTHQGLLALTLELEQRVDDLTAELRGAHEELEKTNSELMQLTLELEDRVAERTEELARANESLRAEVVQRQRADETIQTTLRRFYTVLSSMYTGVLLVTDDSRVEFANQALCDYFGLDTSPAELVGLASADILAGISRAFLHPEAALARIREILDRGEPVRGEEVAMRGGYELLRDFIPIQVNGKSYGRLWYHTDITQRKRVEEALRRANERLEMAQRAARAGMWDWNIATGTLEWSPRMFELLGLDPQAATASFAAWTSTLHPDDRAAAEARIERALAEHADLDSEYRIVRPDGHIVWINALGRGSYDGSGRPVRMAGICIDVTERKRTEEVLRETNEELIRFNQVAVGRELRMIELKKEVNEVCREAGRPPRYPLDFERE